MSLPLPENDPKQRRPDITKAGDILGWRPTVDLKIGLKRTINYFDGLLASAAQDDTRDLFLRAGE